MAQKIPTWSINSGNNFRKDQQEWMQAEETREYPILERARGRLSETGGGFPTEAGDLKLGYAGDIVDTILDEVRSGGYGTLVVTHHGPRFFGNGIAERLSRDLSGVAPGSCNKLRPLLTTGSPPLRDLARRIVVSLPRPSSLCTINR